MPSVSLTYPPRVLYGNDILQNLGTYVAGIAKRALVVTESVMRHESYLATALDSLEERGIECIVFDSISPGATSAVLSEVAELVRASKPQVVIGFGGVRVLAAARFAAHEGSRNWPPSTSSVKYFEVPASCRNPLMFKNEVVITDAATMLPQIRQVRGGILHSVIIDPTLTRTLSPRFFSVAMLDILLSSAEGYLAGSANFYSDTLLERALELVGDSLLDSLRSRGLPLPTEKVCEAGLLSAMGLGATNIGIGSALAFAMNSRYRIPKSWAAAVLLPHILELHLETGATKLAKIAGWLGEDIQGRHAQSVAGKASEATRRMLGLFQLPTRLRDLKLELSDIQVLGEAALALPFATSGPLHLDSGSVSDLLKQAY